LWKRSAALVGIERVADTQSGHLRHRERLGAQDRPDFTSLLARYRDDEVDAVRRASNRDFNLRLKVLLEP